MKIKVLVFAGTTEGRQICEFLSQNNFDVTASVATDYGASLIEGVKVQWGRLSKEDIANLVNNYQFVVDATHPYASIVSDFIQSACKAEKLIRIVRESQEKSGYFNSVQDICTALNSTKGNILLTTGCKDLKLYTNIENYQTRIYARVLPFENSVKMCSEIGLRGSQIICMQGPFSIKMNVATINHVNARFLVTKDTGVNGGFAEKIRAAEITGAVPMVLARPTKEKGLTVAKAMEFFRGLVK